MRIGIIGAGAIGGWVAARLALAGNQVAVLARGETLRALARGITIREQGKSELAQVQASADPTQLGVPDLVIIAVKAPALAGVVEQITPMIGRDTLMTPWNRSIRARALRRDCRTIG